MDNVKQPIFIASILSTLLSRYGVKRVFVSPGSRNASIIEELNNNPDFHLDMVVDERSAAFAAVGYCSASGEPVATLCTSGTAPLNYAPAVAEACYRRLPLIVVTADRPRAWINQDDSQTIPQPGVYSNFTKASFDIPVLKDSESVWYANRCINEALLMATTPSTGPVHINIQIADRPEAVLAECRLASRSIDTVLPRTDMTVKECRELASTIASPRKVLIVAGFMPPSSKLNRALSRLAEFSNVVVMTETVANLHNKLFITSVDRTLKSIDADDMGRYLPDVVISLGGALISRRLKTFLRDNPPAEHWYVGTSDTVIDSFRSLTRIVRMEAPIFFEQFAAALQPHRQPSNYRDLWQILSDKGHSILQSVVAHSPWADLKAFATIIPLIPKRWNVQYSNGTPIRYSQLFGDYSYHRCDCNRGVSGIDGCTSTAIGASLAYTDTTLLITGDMSALYDISAFASGLLNSRMKIIVMNNGGGGIFRFAKSTRELSVRDKFLCGDINLPLEQLCAGFGLRYFKATGEESLRSEFRAFASESSQPCVMEVTTPAEISAEILDKLLN